MTFFTSIILVNFHIIQLVIFLLLYIMQEEEKRNKKMGPNILLAFFYKYRKCHNSQLQIGRVTCVNHTS